MPGDNPVHDVANAAALAALNLEEAGLALRPGRLVRQTDTRALYVVAGEDGARELREVRQPGRWEAIVTGTGNSLEHVTNEAEDDHVYGWVSD